MSGFWDRGIDYDIGSESPNLRELGQPFLVDNLSKKQLGGLVLADIGCWSGRHLRLLEETGRLSLANTDKPQLSILGIDEPFAEPRLEQAKERHPGFTLLNTGIKSTGLLSASVDAAICWRVLHNLTKPGELDSALCEITRILKPNAPFVAAVRAPKVDMPELTQPLKIVTGFDDTVRTDYYFSQEACAAVFESGGFEVTAPIIFSEGEIVKGITQTNDYWMVRAVRK